MRGVFHSFDKYPFGIIVCLGFGNNGKNKTSQITTITELKRLAVKIDSASTTGMNA